MDIRLRGKTQPYRRLKDGGEEAPSSLSQDVQECLQFFEETIDSLEHSLEADDFSKPRRASSSPNPGRFPAEVDGPAGAPSPNPLAVTPRLPGPKDHDIIDLVQPKELSFTPMSPDFQTMVRAPESHFEVKPRRESSNNLPSEYNPPLPGNNESSGSPGSYHPPGCIPTPVLIAHKIAEHQAGVTPSSLLRRRSSLESEKTASHGAEAPGKQGPPTLAKPARYPAKINVSLGGKEHQNQTLANVSIHERRAQMLANLSGTSHALLLEEPKQNAEKGRNVPTRSVSFRDPTPEKSRMEALSKLGLTRIRAMSGGMTLPDPPPPQQETGVKPPEVSVPPPIGFGAKEPEAEVRSPEIQEPPKIVDSSPPPPENPPSFTPPPEVTSLELNNYGGKSIVVTPSVPPKNEPLAFPASPELKVQQLPPPLAGPCELNNYGGKSKAMAAAPRSDLPDILSSHIDKSQTLPAKPEARPAELNSYGGKSRAIHPSGRLSETLKPPVRAPDPKPKRHSYHSTPQKPLQRTASPRRSTSMFRPQGITVQFSGRGATDESRREALRKLGLLKES